MPRLISGFILMLAACLLPLSCMVEGEGDLILDIAVPDSVSDSHYVFVIVVPSEGEGRDTIFRGRAPGKRVKGPTPHYKSVQAMVIFQEYDTTGGFRVDSSILVREIRIRIRKGNKTWEILPSGLSAPSRPFPTDSALDVDTLLDLAWIMGMVEAPRPKARVYLGLTNPPPLLAPFQLEEVFKAGPLLPDSRYFWKVEGQRAGDTMAGPVWSFRTRPRSPEGLVYPALGDSMYVDEPVNLLPSDEGGASRRFRITGELPQGLSLDTVTGRIHGTPLVQQESSEYTLVVSNVSGRAEVKITLRIHPRMVEADPPDSAGHALAMRALLLDSSKVKVIDTLWDYGMPPPGRFRRIVPHYDGKEALILVQGFRNEALVWESWTRINKSMGIIQRLPNPSLPAPELLEPADGAALVDAMPRFTWTSGFSLPGPPLYRFRLGLVNPPPPVADSLREPLLDTLRLLPDTVYYWSVESMRLGQSIPGTVRSFRTRPLSPSLLRYATGDTLLNLDMPVSLSPEYGGGARVLFRVEPGLPPGLGLDSLSGRISGTPASVAARTEHEITATNPSGERSARIVIGVDHRLIDLPLPERLSQADSLCLYLLDAVGNLLDTLWSGAPPAAMKVRKASARYDGKEVLLAALGFVKGGLDQEHWYRKTTPLGPVEGIAPPELAKPSNPFPEASATGVDTLLDLAWKSGVTLPHPPLASLYLGTVNPPPLLRDSLLRTGLTGLALLSDTTYYWRIENLRAGRISIGPTWSFRTRPAAPVRIGYSTGDAALRIDVPVDMTPVYHGGRARFTISPDLAPGLALDSLTGRISGIPSAALSRREYTVTATNATGACFAKLDIRVDARLLDFTLPDTALLSDSIRIDLSDSAGKWLETIWNAPSPADRRILKEAPLYDGKEARLLIQGYRGGILAWESQRRINQKLGIFELLPALPLPAPEPSLPADGVSIADVVVDFAWTPGGDLIPAPMTAIYLGKVNPPPLYRDSLPGLALNGITLQADTTYFWRVENIRAGSRTPGPVRSFSTATSPPRSLAYAKADSVFRKGIAVTLAPAYSGGRNPRYQVLPALPPGLSLDGITGVISGRATEIFPRTRFVITVANEAGSMTDTTYFRVGPLIDTGIHLVARWTGDSILAGDTLVDSSGNGFNGTLEGMAWADGVKGRSYSMSGSALAKIPVRDALALNAFTISFWYKPESQAKPDPLLEYSERDWILGVHIQANTRGNSIVEPGALYCNLRPSDASPEQHGSVRERNIIVTKAGVATLGKWNHVAVTFTPKTWQARIYVNGREEAVRTLQADFAPLTKGRIHLGFRPTDMIENGVDNGYTGGMDEVEIYDEALDSLAIEEIYRTLSP